MSFKSYNFLIQNLSDAFVLGSNTYITANQISNVSSSQSLAYNIMAPEAIRCLAVDDTTIAISYFSNVRLYLLTEAFGLNRTNRSNIIPIFANSASFDSNKIYIGSVTSNNVEVYYKTGFRERTLTSASANSSSMFGHTVYARDGLIYVGAPNNYAGAGSVHVFDRRGIEKAVLKAPTSNSNAKFGFSIAKDGDSLYISAPFDAEGKVYVFDSGYSYVNTIVGPEIGAQFGFSIASGFGHLVVGSPNTASRGTVSIYYANLALVANITQLSYPGVGTGIGSRVSIESGKCLFLNTQLSSPDWINVLDLKANAYSRVESGSGTDRFSNADMITANGNVYVVRGTSSVVYTASLTPYKNFIDGKF
jgi:hypothetical protein